jgi:cytochrome c-type biogenesis protein CcmH/NrfG
MTRSSLYFIVVALAVLAVGLAAYAVYQQNQQPSLEIKVDENGIKIDGNN